MAIFSDRRRVMDDKLMLMIPGPTPVPEKALTAMGRHPIGHRSGEFSELVAEVFTDLKWLHQTQNDVLVLTASGTGGDGSWDYQCAEFRRSRLGGV